MIISLSFHANLAPNVMFLETPVLRRGEKGGFAINFVFKIEPRGISLEWVLCVFRCQLGTNGCHLLIHLGSIGRILFGRYNACLDTTHVRLTATKLCESQQAQQCKSADASTMHQETALFPKISACQRTGRLARGDVPSHSSNVRRRIIHHVSTMCTFYVHRWASQNLLYRSYSKRNPRLFSFEMRSSVKGASFPSCLSLYSLIWRPSHNRRDL
mmetsp:Transcript_22173/g.40288  ORF Transcript_22173/g.40288 Transcript_22173/m.40288 type:complete len:214 (-) Transcript_22173:481-1122(-)